MTRKQKAHLLSISLFVAGVATISYVVYPILAYEINQGTANYISPVPEGKELVFSKNKTKNIQSNNLTNPQDWFAKDENVNYQLENQTLRYYTVSIPSLKIEKATVALGGEDLSLSLIQYPGTALPGKKGNTVIFGHSILPQFFNPKDYLSIFSTLPTIKKGEEITINYDGIAYKYEVVEKFEVKPNQLDVLSQNEDNSYISLITCVPPGNPLRPKRLVVRAKIVKI